MTGSFIINTSVTVPNIPKYSRNFSALVCQLRPPTNNLPGAGSVPELAVGVDRPEEPDWDVVVASGHCAGIMEAIFDWAEMGGEPLTALNAFAVPFRGFIAISAFWRSWSIRALAVSMLVALEVGREGVEKIT